MLLNNEWVNNEIKEEIKRYLGQIKISTHNPKSMGHKKRSARRETHSVTGLS